MAERKALVERLQDNNLTYVWLINVLSLSGVNTDKSEMSSVIHGTRSGEKADSIIRKSHEILDKYEHFILDVTHG